MEREGGERAECLLIEVREGGGRGGAYMQSCMLCFLSFNSQGDSLMNYK